MKVTINGVTYEITVTDDTDAITYRYYDTSAKTFKTGTVPDGATTWANISNSDDIPWDVGAENSESWVVVSGEVTCRHIIRLKGTINMVICDGAAFQVGGLGLYSNATLNIYAQSDSSSTMGQITSNMNSVQ